MHKKIVREDGSVIILLPLLDSKSVTWEVEFKVGSRQEPKKINGVSHFVEHLMFKGTKKRPTTMVLSRELDSVGAQYNAFTGKDHTGYYIQTDVGNFSLGIDMLSDMLNRSKFEEKEMDRERGVITEELNIYRDNPTMRIDEIFESAMFHNSSLGWEIGGPRKTIADMLHKDLLAFKKKMYYPGNMVIGLAGNFQEDKALKLINRYFPVKKKKAKASIKPHVWKQDKPRVVLEQKDTEQVRLMLGFPGYSRTHKNANALLLLSTIMGGTMSSRLFINIRERKGLAYDIRSSSEAYEDVGYFSVQGGFDKDKAFKSLEAIKSELVRVKSKGVTREELKRAKDNIRGRMTLRFESQNVHLSYLLSQELLTDKVELLEDKLDKIDKVKIEDVNRVARSVINWKKSTLALIGPFKSKKKFLDVINSRPSK